MPKTIKIFDYVSKLDCFKPNGEYLDIAGQLNLIEWNPVVWIGRYFLMDKYTYQQCVSPMECVDGNCKCPGTGDYCTMTEFNEGTTKCIGNVLYKCAGEEEGCYTWIEERDCIGEGMICID